MSGDEYFVSAIAILFTGITNLFDGVFEGMIKTKEMAETLLNKRSAIYKGTLMLVI
ncbi:hypothetical protein GCM10011501_20490 [Thalassotalea profundi]|uniref:DUF1275 domain-containing protein n=1 Tax=Thalassotalea profundi TaxID=2036687 RepID=A0ABQ3IU24_9GAMM|nr:hypothetical protein GCM10011501_20490 [Thalassotalea profundi]